MAAGLCRLTCLCLILGGISGFTFIQSFPDNTDQCENVCQSTYPPHTYDKVFDMGYCMRGCRFFAILEYTNEDRDLNNTLQQCQLSCGEAYQQKADAEACSTGCKGQLPVIQKRRKKMYQMHVGIPDPNINPMYPLLYVHSMYSNMVEKMIDHVCETWSFHTQGDWTGKIVVIERVGRPAFVSYEAHSPQTGEYKTVNYLETNLAAVDNSATPNIKRSQLPVDVNTDLAVKQDEVPADWLGCVAKKTGLPRLFISFTIFLSAMMMVWLCFASVATAPDHRIHVQKLSINGDLEYLNEMGEKKGMVFAPVRLQEDTDASPLPFKIQLEQI